MLISKFIIKFIINIDDIHDTFSFTVTIVTNIRGYILRRLYTILNSRSANLLVQKRALT